MQTRKTDKTINVNFQHKKTLHCREQLSIMIPRSKSRKKKEPQQTP